MGPKYKVRLANAEDAEAIVQFNAMMAKETEDRDLDMETLRRGVRSVFARGDRGFYVVAVSEDQVIAQLMVTFEWSDWRAAWFWWIQSVYVIPERRREGIYRGLYKFVKRLSVKRGGVCGFRLYVARENDIARSAYLSLGMDNSRYEMYEESKE
ncbi:MAG: GNAT family N-acetyltransferase [Planctomycetota bacterium]|nr:GNAT family N-acetyltransferase [Planctomycetota bacterium]MDA1140006.1 GNAT family N-acetyltransferase [Planctomycetota bacterium]